MLSRLSTQLAITYSDPSLATQAVKLAKRLNGEVVPPTSSHYSHPWLITCDPNGLSLQNTEYPQFKPFAIDFINRSLSYRTQSFALQRELLAKACGIKKNYRPTIIDTTAGLGHDAFILAYLGCEVTMLERHPLIAELLSDALTRWHIYRPDYHLPLKLITINAMEYLRNLNVLPEVIYLDPMYPHRQKSALVKKEMRLLRELVGDDEDAAELFMLARDRALKRVVIKRPYHAPALAQAIPHCQFKGKSIRFDVYLRDTQNSTTITSNSSI